MDKLSKNINFYLKLKKIFFPFYKSSDTKNLFRILEKDKPKNAQVAMFVGGCVRKFLNDEDIDDIDIATIFSPKEIKEKFKDSNFKIIDTGIEHGSVTIIINSKKFEVTSLRQDVKTDGRHAEVSFIDNWKEDSERRDFTINAIYMDIRGRIYDPQNGREDLKNNIINFIGDPSQRIAEDYLRIIRYLRFCIQYNIKNSEPKIINSIKLNLNGTKNLSKERILSELNKIFNLQNINILTDNEEIRSIFLLIFPELKYLERLKKYTFATNPELIFSVLLIDEKDNFEYFCHKYRVSNNLKSFLNLIAKNYNKYKEEKNFLKKDLKKNIYNCGKKNIKSLIKFIYCSESKFSEKLLVNLLDEVDKIKIPNFPFNGQYLKEKGLTEGKEIGFVLKELEKEWLDKDFNLNKNDAATIIDKVKRSSVLNV
ncbi:MAG: CCA tRNA nucleotidyltransferase [Pelagibacteraceae bacterium]|nr:CCA tRNA nucleotidyltransferase [Pelagibacteraceae bacterium]